MAPPSSGHVPSPSSGTDIGASRSAHHGRARQQDQPTHDITPWKAGCGGSRTPGSDGAPEKPTNRKAGRALRPDPYTYIPTGGGWLFVASVFDVYTSMIVSWSIEDHLGTGPCTDATTTAIRATRSSPGIPGGPLRSLTRSGP